MLSAHGILQPHIFLLFSFKKSKLTFSLCNEASKAGKANKNKQKNVKRPTGKKNAVEKPNIYPVAELNTKSSGSTFSTGCTEDSFLTDQHQLDCTT